MNSQQAREILLLYRPGIDPRPPEIEEALGLARRDPDLQAWFAEHCAAQAELRKALRKIPVPPGLREKILAARPARKIVWWRQPAAWAAAAALAALLALAAFWFGPRQEDSFANYRERMVSTALRNYNMQMVTADLGQVRQYLSQNGPHGDYAMPAALEQLPAEGCAVLSWHGRKVSLICLKENERDDLYLFVINQSELYGEPSRAEPRFARVNRLMTAAWSANGKLYLLAGPGEEAAFSRYVN